MVSLTAAEEALGWRVPAVRLALQIAVLARPRRHRGRSAGRGLQRAKTALDEIRAAIKAKGFKQPLWPKELKYVRDIPKLGTGKVDHRRLQKNHYGRQNRAMSRTPMSNLKAMPPWCHILSTSCQ